MAQSEPPLAEDGIPPIAETGKNTLWNLNEQEQRLLLITFVGGLASIVVGAAIVGGALALSRWFVRRNGDGILDEFTWAYFASGVGLLMWRLGWLRTGDEGRFERWMRPFGSGLWIVGAAYIMLVWIGIAVGVK